MFRKWLDENKVEAFDLSAPLFPKACDRNVWDKKYNCDIVKNAESYVGYEWPLIRATDYMEFNISGSRIKQEIPHHARRKALHTLVLGEILENKGRFIHDIVDGIFAICEESYWGLSAHKPPHKAHQNIPDPEECYIDLFAGETAALLATTYYMLYDEIFEFCPDILFRIEQELERRIITPYLYHKDYWWMGYYDSINNWNPWIISNIVTVFLLCEKRHTVKASGIRKMIFEINRIYDAYLDDGGCDEGPAYWKASGGSLFEFCEQLYLASNGKINFFDDKKLRNIFLYEYRAYIGNGNFINFADGSPKAGSELAGLSYSIGKRIQSPEVLGLAKEMFELQSGNKNVGIAKIIRSINELLNTEEISACKPFAPNNSFIFENIQVSISRCNDWYYAAKGGHNSEKHNHNDVGSFVVYYQSNPVLIDPGCAVYTKKTFSAQRYEIWTNRSAWHNVPLINEVEQQQGITFAADSFSFVNSTTTVSFSKAYPEISSAEKVLRTLKISENGVEISDSFTFSQDLNSISEHFITHLDTEIKENCVIIGGKFVLRTKSVGKFICDSVNFDGDTNLTNSWGCDKINRIKFEFQAGKDTEIHFILEEYK